MKNTVFVFFIRALKGMRCVLIKGREEALVLLTNNYSSNTVQTKLMGATESSVQEKLLKE